MLRRAMMAAQVSGAGDPHWASVVSLLKFNGVSGNPGTADETGRVWTTNSGALLSDGHAFFPSDSLTSVRFTGSGGYMGCGGSDDLQLLGDFTIELWFRPTSLPNAGLVDMRGNNSSIARPALYVASGVLRVLWLGVDRIVSPALAINTSYHIVLQRRDAEARMFVNGVLAGTTSAMAGWAAGSDGIRLGMAAYPYGSSTVGYMDEFRVTNGVARYPDAGFATPSDPFPAG